MGSRTPSFPIEGKKKKKTHIPITIQNMDDLEIGGQLIVPNISSSIEKIVDESNSKVRPTSNDRQARTSSSNLNY